MDKTVIRTEMPEAGIPARGKVRDIYDLGDHLLLVATDRVSAFDTVLPDAIPEKGRVLTELSLYWFRETGDIVKNHLVSTAIRDFPAVLHKYADTLSGRSMLVRKVKPLPVECIVRGYISGSAWKEYCSTKSVCGIPVNKLMRQSSAFSEPIFTPSTKAQDGHDLNISFAEMSSLIGADLASRVRDISLKLYFRASEKALKKGIIIADTKFEFGLLDGQTILIDEVLTPDSSRFWSLANYAPGRAQDSFDKQIVRDYLDGLGWDKNPPGPVLPADVIIRTSERYREILSVLTA